MDSSYPNQTDILGMSEFLLAACTHGVEHQLTSDIVASPCFIIENALKSLKTKFTKLCSISRTIQKSNLTIPCCPSQIKNTRNQTPILSPVGITSAQIKFGEAECQVFLNAPIIVLVGDMLCWLFVKSVDIHCRATASEFNWNGEIIHSIDGIGMVGLALANGIV